MTTLRPDISIDVLNERGSEYLPGYLGIEILELAPNTLSSRMPVKKLHFAPNDFLHVGSSRVDLQACKLEYSIVSPK